MKKYIFLIIFVVVILVSGNLFLARSTGWHKYVNTRLEFSLMLPPLVYDRTTEKQLSLMVYDNEKSPNVYLATSEEDWGWEIMIKNAPSFAVLESVIKDYFGEACNVESQTPRVSPGDFDLVINGSEDCMILAKIAVVYSPSKQKVMIGFGQQDAVFVAGPEEDAEIFDSRIKESFRFL